MDHLKYPFLFVCVLFVELLHAQSKVQVKQFENNKEWSFVENKGQLVTHNPPKGGKWILSLSRC